MIRKVAITILTIIIIFFIGGTTGYFYRGTEKPKIEIVYETEIVEKWRDRKTTKKDVVKMPISELQKELFKYIDDEPELDIKIIESENLIRATAALGDREWSKDAKYQVEIARFGNWKVYAGIGAVLLFTGGTAGFLLARKR